MEEMLQLLQHRNHFLEKFLTENENQTQRMKSGNFDGVDEFYQNREQMLEQIRYIDQRLQEESEHLGQSLSSDLGSSGSSDHLKSQIRIELSTKDEYVRRILDQDMEILTLMDEFKSFVVKELQEIEKSRKSISKYKNPSFNQRLSEKA